MAHRLMGFAWVTANVVDGGAYRIKGTASRQGQPGVYRVALFDRDMLRLVRLTKSAADGAYLFYGLKYRPNGYFAVEFDDPRAESPLNASIADLITPEPIA